MFAMLHGRYGGNAFRLEPFLDDRCLVALRPYSWAFAATEGRRGETPRFGGERPREKMLPKSFIDLDVCIE